MTRKAIDWIICSQRVEDLRRYSGPVVWINECLRCGTEEPIYQGALDVLVYQGKRFINFHKNCKEK